MRITGIERVTLKRCAVNLSRERIYRKFKKEIPTNIIAMAQRHNPALAEFLTKELSLNQQS